MSRIAYILSTRLSDLFASQFFFLVNIAGLHSKGRAALSRRLFAHGRGRKHVAVRFRGRKLPRQARQRPAHQFAATRTQAQLRRECVSILPSFLYFFRRKCVILQRICSGLSCIVRLVPVQMLPTSGLHLNLTFVVKSCPTLFLSFLHSFISCPIICLFPRRYFHDALTGGNGSSSSSKEKLPKQRKGPPMHDFQFFERARLEALLELEYQHEVQRAQVSSYYLSLCLCLFFSFLCPWLCCEAVQVVFCSCCI